LAICPRCRYRLAREGLKLCSECEQRYGENFSKYAPATVWNDPPATETANCFTRGGLTYASLNGREVCPDILIVHGSVEPEEAAWELARLRAQPQPATVQPDLEWDPPAPGERVPDRRSVTYE
jgi:hypothetical protein